MFWHEVTRLFDLKGNWSLEKSCCKRKSWNVSTAAWAWEWGKIAASLKSYWKPPGQTAEQSWTLFPLPLNTSVWWGEGPVPWIFCSAWELDFKRRGRTLWVAVLIIHSRWDLLTCPSTSSGYLWEKSILPFIGKQWTFCCSFQLLTCVSKLFLVSQAWRARTEILSIKLKMKSICPYLKFNQELSICAAKTSTCFTLNR
jgi:hypothetical protein